jgi:DNA-binding MarR family transcriptional regulator
MKNASFDDLIHAPNRLMICAILEPVSEMEFALLKEQLAVSDSVLSKHLKALSDANYLNLEKVTQNGRQRTWLSLSKTGTDAYNAHVRALKSILGA